MVNQSIMNSDMEEEPIVQHSKNTVTIKRKTVILIIIFVLCVISAFVIGLAISTTKSGKVAQANESEDDGERSKIHQQIAHNIRAANLRENLRYLALKPHIAGLQRNNEIGDELHRRFKSFGFKSEKESFNVLLSYPNKNKPNFAHLLDDAGKTYFKTQQMETIFEPSENSSLSIPPFNAYSPGKTVEGDLVYVNYGRYEDFKLLEDHFNVSCKGKIVIVRYGKIFRGDKVLNAQTRGAIGVLIYSDPAEYGPVPDQDVFPNGWWLSRDGVQRGSVGRGDGDPLTPGFASTDGAYRIDPNSNTKSLPSIPSQPISAQDAFQFLSRLGGKEVRMKSWTGMLNLTYKVGPGFDAKHAKWKVRVEVHNVKKQTRITNIIGTLKGSTEPDRYVLMGNHYDAWGFGAVDASSGTAVMMEVARSLAEKAKTGWRPRRTIIFCAWDGEEHSIIGSSEWVERHIKILKDRAVAYVNVDSGVYGNYSISARASPLVYATVLEAAGKTKDPFESLTALEKFKMAYPSKSRPGQPHIFGLGSGSDFLKFYQLAGIPSFDISYTMRQVDRKYNTSHYPVYHSLHDTFYWMTKFVDPTFKCHQTVARVTANVLLSIADSPLIPWNVNDYAIELKRGVVGLKKLLGKNNAGHFNVSTAYLEDAINRFSMAAEKFHKSVKTKDLTDTLKLRMINDKLMQLEKGFICPEGLPGRPYTKHLIYAPSLYNMYGSTLFSGVSDQLFDIKKNPSKWETVKHQLTILTASIDGTAETISDV